MMKEHEARELQILKQRHAIFQVLTPEQQQQLLNHKPRSHNQNGRAPGK
ncbi:hypothetical protein [Kingella kingae]|nr:hypothetical protein [Kingella kingae]